MNEEKFKCNGNNSFLLWIVIILLFIVLSRLSEIRIKLETIEKTQTVHIMKSMESK